MNLTIHPDARALIRRFEGCSPHPEWPGEDSGITIGIGCDIGADPDSLEAWRGLLLTKDFGRLSACRGYVGTMAEGLLLTVADIEIPRDAAEAVFDGYTLPREMAATAKAFPGSDRLPPESFGSLVSLVYNRGSKMTGDRRVEMRAICNAVNAVPQDLEAVPVELASMTRLWPERPTVSNLPGRRLAEAALFAKGLRTAGLSDPQTLLLGDSEARVSKLQAALQVLPDGSYGFQTLRAVLRYQDLQGLPQTGVADPQVLHQLKV